MTQTSYFHQGVVHGDADLSGFADVSRINGIMRKASFVSTYIYGGISLRLYNIGVPSTLRLDPGYAVVGGYAVRFGSTQDLVFPVVSVGGDPLWNRVIIRVDKINETASVVVLSGLPAPIPEKPQLQEENECVVEMALWSVLSRPGTSSFAYMMYDERRIWTEQEPSENLIRNGSFVGGPGSGLNGGPAYWNTSGAPLVETERLQEPFSYGQFLKVTFTAGDYMYSASPIITNNNNDRWVTIQFQARAENGLGYFSHSIPTGFTMIIPESEELITFTYRYLADAGNTTLRPSFGSSSGCTMYISPITATYGLTPVPPMPREELVLFWEPVVIKNGTTTDGDINLLSVHRGMKSVLLDAYFSDSASAANPSSTTILKDALSVPASVIDTAGLPNGSRRCDQFFVQPYFFNREPFGFKIDWSVFADVTTSGTKTGYVKWVGAST